MLNIVKFCDSMNQVFMQRGLTAYASYAETVEKVNLAQQSLFNEYRRLFEVSGHVSDAINPFKQEETITVTNGLVIPAQDWVYTVGMSFHDVYNDGCEVVHRDTGIPEMLFEQASASLNARVRQPTLGNPKRYYVNGAWVLKGRTTGTVKHAYVRRPVEASIVTTVDPLTMEEIPVSQVNLEWNREEYDKLVKICLFWAGVAVQDQFVVQAASNAPA